MNNFDICFKWILEIEGGYVNDKKDSGGETKYGISKKAYPNLDIKNLTELDAKRIYFNDYYQPLLCSKMSPLLAISVLDCGVNQGNSVAVKLLQKALGVNNDGIIGLKTIDALNKTNHKELYTYFSTFRVLRYTTYKQFDDFGIGWVRRLFRLNLFILKYSDFFKGN